MPAPSKQPLATPGFRVFRQMPSVPQKTVWQREEIEAALCEHERGMFAGSAQIADAITRDDALDAVVSTRVLGLLGLPRNVEPSLEVDPRRARKVARDVDERFDQIFPRATLAELLKWGILLGVALAQIVWRTDVDGIEWIPEIEVWHPSFVYYRPDIRRYVAITTEGPVIVEPGTGQWILYTPTGSDRGWMGGAIRSIAVPWLARSYAWRDWQRWSELYGLGIRKAMAPAEAAEVDKDAFFQQVARLGNETTVLLTKNQNGGAYDVDILWPEGQSSADGFERLMTKCESRIAIRILGQNLTTEVQSGSLAAARVHENVKLDIIQFDDRTLSETLRAQVLRPYCRFNYAGGEALAPRVGRKTAPTEDRKNEADTLVGAASALDSLVTAGVPVDVRAFAERFGVPLLPAAPPEDDSPHPEDAAPEAPAPGATKSDPKRPRLPVGEGAGRKAAPRRRKSPASGSDHERPRATTAPGG